MARYVIEDARGFDGEQQVVQDQHINALQIDSGASNVAVGSADGEFRSLPVLATPASS